MPNGYNTRIHLIQLSWELNEITHTGCFTTVPGTDTGFCLTLVMCYHHDNKDPYLCLSPFKHHSFSVPMFIFISSNLYFFHYQLHSYFCCCCFSLFTLSSSSETLLLRRNRMTIHSHPCPHSPLNYPPRDWELSEGRAWLYQPQHSTALDTWTIKNMFKSWLQSLGYLNTNGDDRILMLKDNA